MEHSTISYYELNKDKIKQRYIKKREVLIAYQKNYYSDNREKILEKQPKYNAKYYKLNRNKILLNNSLKVCCLNCHREISNIQLNKHFKTNICKKNTKN